MGSSLGIEPFRITLTVACFHWVDAPDVTQVYQNIEGTPITWTEEITI